MTRAAAGTASTPVRASAPADPDFGLDDYLFDIISRLELAFRKQVQKALRGAGLSLAEWRTLAVLREQDGISVTELARRTVTERTALTRTIQKMVDRGLIERRVSGSDRRAVQISVTPAGARYLEEVRPLVDRVYRRVTRGIDDDQLAEPVVDLRGLLDGTK